MSANIFFERKGPYSIKDLFNLNNSKNFKIKDIKTLDKATKTDLSFFDSIRYKDFALRTKAGCCITSSKLENYLPKECIKIVVKNVLFELAKTTKKFYPSADIDYPDLSLSKPKLSKFSKVKFLKIIEKSKYSDFSFLTNMMVDMTKNQNFKNFL